MWLRWAVAYAVSVAMISGAAAVETSGLDRVPFVLTKKDFPNIPANPSICNEVGLKCLEQISGDDAFVLQKPVRLADFTNLGDAGFKHPAQNERWKYGGFEPIIAFVEVAEQMGSGSEELKRSQIERVSRLFPPTPAFEWNMWLTTETIRLVSETDRDLTADALCRTASVGWWLGPVRDCTVYRIYKSGKTYEATVIGAKFKHATPYGVGMSYYPTDFVRRVGPTLASIIGSSRFMTQDYPRNELILTRFGARIIEFIDNVAGGPAQRVMLEIMVETDFPQSRDSSFYIASRTTVTANKTPEGGVDGPTFWYRSSKTEQSQWDNETQHIVAKLGKALCQIYGNRKVASDVQPDRDIAHLEESSTVHRITCSRDKVTKR